MLKILYRPFMFPRCLETVKGSEILPFVRLRIYFP
jgi:hypothetical protein